MDTEVNHDAIQASQLTSWEKWVNTTFAWLPYGALALSAAIFLIGSSPWSERTTALGLAAAAALWTWATFTRRGAPSEIAQPGLRLYFVGFVVVAMLLMTQSPIFLIYGITGFFHGSLLRPWALAFLGIAATGFIVHSHIVLTESTPTTWAIYLGVVAFQTVAVFGGLYAGQKITEIADQRRLMVEQLELAMIENAGLHDQLVAQAREAGVLDERQRMAREIHDTIAQGLTGVVMQIEAIRQSKGDEDELQRRLDTAAALARDSLAEARRSAQAIRPTPLENSRLPDALGKVAAEWSDANRMPVQVHREGELRPLHPEIEVALLRTAQESLANVAKHAAATRVVVTLTFLDDAVVLDVRDDGAGFDTGLPIPERSLGLAAMRQRVNNVNGVMQLESAPGEGTAVSIQIPTKTVDPDDD